MGLTVYVYKHGGYDGTLDGISGKAQMLTLTNVDGPFAPTEKCPAAKLVQGAFPGTVVIKPDAPGDEKKWWMAGGNFAATSDSRFWQAIEKIIGARFYGAVAIHDRYEG